jgi:hypothetical protein
MHASMAHQGGNVESLWPFLSTCRHLNRFDRGDTVVILRESVRLITIEVNPFDAVGVGRYPP